MTTEELERAEELRDKLPYSQIIVQGDDLAQLFRLAVDEIKRLRRCNAELHERAASGWGRGKRG